MNGICSLYKNKIVNQWNGYDVHSNTAHENSMLNPEICVFVHLKMSQLEIIIRKMFIITTAIRQYYSCLRIVVFFSLDGKNMPNP